MCNNAVYHMMCVMRCGHISPSVTAWELILNTRPSLPGPRGRFGCPWVRGLVLLSNFLALAGLVCGARKGASLCDLAATAVKVGG